jgi:hypothetical protein
MPPVRFMSSFRLRLTPVQYVWVGQVARDRAVSRAEVIRSLLRSELQRLSAAEGRALEAAAAKPAAKLADDVDETTERAAPAGPPARRLVSGATVTLRQPDDDANGTTRVRIRSSRAT